MLNQKNQKNLTIKALRRSPVLAEEVDAQVPDGRKDQQNRNKEVKLKESITRRKEKKSLLTEYHNHERPWSLLERNNDINLSEGKDPVEMDVSGDGV